MTISLGVIYYRPSLRVFLFFFCPTKSTVDPMLVLLVLDYYYAENEVPPSLYFHDHAAHGML